MSAGGAPSVRVDLDADLSPYAAKLADARSQAEALIRSIESNQARLDIDTSEASRNLSDIATEIAGLSTEDASILVEANTDDASGALADLQSEAESLDGSAPSIDVEADTSDAESAVEDLTSQLEGLGDGVEPIALEVDADQAIDALGEIEDQLFDTGSSVLDMKSMLAGFGVGLGIEEVGRQIIGMAQAAAEDAASVERLNQAVINAEGSLRGHADALAEAVARGQELAFSDDATRDALVQLTNATGDADEALRRLSTAQNLARGAGIDLVTAAKLLGRVSDENVGALRRYGVAVEDGATAQQLLNEVDRRFAGQAGKFAESDAGKFVKMADAVGEAQEAIGVLLLPAVVAFTDAIVDVTEGVTTLTGIVPQLSEALLGNEKAFGKAGEAAESYSEKLRDNGQAFAEWGAKTGIAIATAPVKWWFDIGDAADDASEGLAEFFSRTLDVVRAATQARQPLLDVSNILKGLNNDSGVSGQSLDKFGGALGRQAVYAGEANYANEALIETIESGNNVFAIAAYQMDLLSRSAAGLAEVQGNINDIMGVFSSQGSEYSSTQNALEAGYEALQTKQEQGLELSASEQQFMQEYPTLLGRVEGAQQDATIQEGLAAAAKTEVMLAQDQLNEAIARGDKDLGPYQEHLSNAQGLLNDVDPNSGMQLALDNLAEVMGVNLPQKIDELIAKLGELDDTKAEPEAAITDNATPILDDIMSRGEDFSSETYSGNLAADSTPFDNTIDGANDAGATFEQQVFTTSVAADPTPFDGTMDGVEGRLTEFDGSEGRADVNADDYATAVIDGASGALTAFDGKTASATLYLNTDPFYSALEASAAMLPHSPAEEGPMAFEPDWSYLTEAMPEQTVPLFEDGIRQLASYVPAGGMPDRGPLADPIDWSWLFAGLDAEADDYGEQVASRLRSYLTGIDLGTIVGDALDLQSTITELEAVRVGLLSMGDAVAAGAVSQQIADLQAQLAAMNALIETDAVQAWLDSADATKAAEEAAQRAADAAKAYAEQVRQAALAYADLLGGLSNPGTLDSLAEDMRSAGLALDVALKSGADPTVIAQLRANLNDAVLAYNQFADGLQTAIENGLLTEDEIMALAEQGGDALLMALESGLLSPEQINQLIATADDGQRAILAAFFGEDFVAGVEDNLAKLDDATYEGLKSMVAQGFLSGQELVEAVADGLASGRLTIQQATELLGDDIQSISEENAIGIIDTYEQLGQDLANAYASGDADAIAAAQAAWDEFLAYLATIAEASGMTVEEIIQKFTDLRDAANQTTETLSGVAKAFGGSATETAGAYDSLTAAIREQDDAAREAAAAPIWEAYRAGAITLEEAKAALDDVEQGFHDASSAASRSAASVYDATAAFKNFTTALFNFHLFDRLGNLQTDSLDRLMQSFALDPEGFEDAFSSAFEQAIENAQKALLSGQEGWIDSTQQTLREMQQLAATLGIDIGDDLASGVNAGLTKTATQNAQLALLSGSPSWIEGTQHTLDTTSAAALMALPQLTTPSLTAPGHVLSGGTIKDTTIVAHFSDEDIRRLAAEVGRMTETGTAKGAKAGTVEGWRAVQSGARMNTSLVGTS